MAGRTTGRALAVGALATVLVGTTGGPATAAPPTVSTLRSAGVILTDPDPAGAGAFVTFDVFAPPGEHAFGVGEVFVPGYECLADERAPATITGLRAATSTGTVPLTCGSETAPPEGIPGQAVVELTWSGEGTVQRSTTVDRDRRCVTRTGTRQARVAGSVHVTVPALEVDVTVSAPADGAAIREERSICLRPA